MILGYAGKNPRQWIADLKRNHPEVKDAWDVGRKLVDLKLVQTAFERATGVDYDEVTTNYKTIEKMADGQPTLVEIPVSRKVTPKKVLPDSTLLFKLLCNRLPEYFQDVKKFQVDKRIMEVKGDISETIKNAAGKLMKLAETPIEAEFEDAAAEL